MAKPHFDQSWDDLKLVLAVAQTGSLSLAAKRLGTDQSTVSRRLHSLDAQLGAKLFERTRRGATATEVGRLVAKGGERVEERIRELQDSLTRTQWVSGSVRLTTSEGLALHFVIPRILPQIERRYPSLELQLLTTDRTLDLERHEADLALRFAATKRGDLVCRKLGDVRLALLARASQARRLSQHPVEELPWLSCVPAQGPALPIATSNITPRFSFSSMESMVMAIRQGLGVGVAAAALTNVYPELTELGHVALRLPKLPLYLVTRSSIRHSPKIDALWHLLADELEVLVGM